MNWWCSETATSMELALINCRQLEKVCGGTNLIVLADKNATKVTRIVDGMTA